MFCKYCGSDSESSDICSKCSEKINNFMQNNSDGKDINNNEGYNWYKEQLENSEKEEKPVECEGLIRMFLRFRFCGIVCCVLYRFSFPQSDL